VGLIVNRAPGPVRSHTLRLARLLAFHKYSSTRRHAVSAQVINLEEYRRKKQDEKSAKKLKGLGFPDDFSPFTGPDDQPEDFGLIGLFSGLRNLVLDDDKDRE